MVRSLVPMARSADLDEILGPEVGTRLSLELGAALRRRSPQEAALSGLLRLLTGTCARLRDAAATSLDQLVRRNSLDRPLYSSLLRALIEANEPRVVGPLVRALGAEDGGGLSTIAAAALSDVPDLLPALLQLASSRSPQIAFAADVARVARGESDGSLCHAIAPRIKESHRIELSERLFLPLLRARRAVTNAVPALEILRDTERHLGRWLCMAELAMLSGDATVVARSKVYAGEGASSARAAWSFVAWALDPTYACANRPTLEIVARLSDRPSAERDLTFLFRMGEAGLDLARVMLESLAKSATLATDQSVRAAAQLVRHYGREDLVPRLAETARSVKREPLRGLALAALADGQASALVEVPMELLKSKHHATVGFAALVRVAKEYGDRSPILSEITFRRLQLGWAD